MARRALDKELKSLAKRPGIPAPDGPERDSGDRRVGDDPSLQLAIGRDGLFFELSGPLRRGPVIVERARAKILGLSFPVDVSGGVERFRHRRTELTEVSLKIDLAELERWIGARADNLLGPGIPRVRVHTRGRSLALSLFTPSVLFSMDLVGGSLLHETGNPVVVYGGGARICVSHDQAMAPATTIAVGLFLRFAAALDGETQGLRLRLEDPMRELLYAAFVSHGARMPGRGVVLSEAVGTREGLRLTFSKEPPRSVALAASNAIRGSTEQTGEDTPQIHSAMDSALFTSLAELDGLIGRFDALLAQGDAAGARDGYLRALETVPKHPALLLRLAELDSVDGARWEAALSWLRDTPKEAQVHLEAALARGLLAARLHLSVGSVDRAIAAYVRVSRRAETHGDLKLAARASGLAAQLLPDDHPELMGLLDAAIGWDPTITDARLRRARLRMIAGQDAPALADVQHLEASARNKRERRDILLAAAELFRSTGHLDRAITVYERALRHAPEDRAAVLGLGRALGSTRIDEGAGRGAALLVHALSLPMDSDQPDDAEILLTLGRILADNLQDVPSAMARVAEVGLDHPRSPLAQGLFAAYAVRLSDFVTALPAFARAAELAGRRVLSRPDAEELSALLLEGSNVSREVRDLGLARVLAHAALRLMPNNEATRAQVERLGRVGELTQLTSSEITPPDGNNVAMYKPVDEPKTEAEQEARAEDLLARVKANPSDEPAVSELVDLLAKLGRDLELFAILSARFDDATAQERLRLTPRQREVLLRLAAASELQGRSMEAGLYRDAAKALG